jgi:uncharacterized RDD family membrane protein YckC
MIACSSCGRSLMDGSVSCDECGALVEPPRRADHAPRSPGWTSHVEIRFRRILAGALDLLPLMALTLLIIPLRRRGLGPMRLARHLPVIAPVVLLMLRDAVGGRSPGKLLTGLRAVDRQTGAPAGVPESILRNVPLLPILLWPFMRRTGPFVIVIIGSFQILAILISQRGLTDFLAGTRVKRAGP